MDFHSLPLNTLMNEYWHFNCLAVQLLSSPAAKNSKGIHTTSFTLTVDGWALTIWLQAMFSVAPLYVKMADSWLRGFQTCLEVHLEQHSSQLPPLYFPWGSSMDCINRFTTSSRSRCFCCVYVLIQGSLSPCVNLLCLVIHLAEE